MVKYIYMGTPGIAARILEKLCESEYPPALVVTQTAKPKGRGQKVTPSEVERYARTQDLNVLETLDVNMPGTADVLNTFHPDLILVVAFGQILKENVLKIPKLGCLNVHASLLPRYRGAAPVQRAIMNGERETGVTIQKIVKKLDAGDVLIQKKLVIGSEETSGDLLLRLAEVGAEALLEAIKLVESGSKLDFKPQDESQATYAKKLEKSEANLDWSLSADSLAHYVRGLQPWPVAQMELHGEVVRIFKVQVVPGWGASPGSVRSDKKTNIEVQCGDGQALSLLEIQQEGRKRLTTPEFLKGYRWPSID